MSLACRPELVLPLELVETVYPWVREEGNTHYNNADKWDTG